MPTPVSATKLGMAIILAEMLTKPKTRKEMVELSGLSVETIREWISALTRPSHKLLYISNYVTVYKIVNDRKMPCGLVPAYKVGSFKDVPKPKKLNK